MPTYNYKCEKCDHVFEIVQKMSDDKLSTCPECSEPSLVRVIGETGGFRIGGKGVHKPTAHWGS